MEVDNMPAIIDAARQGAVPTKLAEADGVAFWLVPGISDHPSTIQQVDGRKNAPSPLRKTGRVVVFDAASFNQVIADNSDAGNVAIYLDRNPDKPSVVAVLNGNGKTGAGWADFRADISFRQTPQWAKWKALDGKMVGQATFAEFIEDNLEDIAEPSGATMLEIATYLEVARSVSFKSALRLTSGVVQFKHDTDDSAKVSANTIDVPQEFALGIAPIFGLPNYRVPARFRYRLTDGKLTLGFKLQRVETMMAQIIEDVISKIERGANVSVMDGLPPA
jgi:uncharacterized protein YfdQ (DUF2303 family)